MGAGTPENESGPAVERGTCALGEPRAMEPNTLVAIERDDTDEESNQITRALDLDTTACIEVRGGDVVFVPVLERTDDGAALKHTGEDCPVAATSVYSEHELRSTLSELGYAGEHIESALATDLDDERGRQVARIAESRTHDHPAQIGSGDGDSDASEEGSAGAPIATDGGTATETCTESRREYPPCERCGDRTWFAKKSLKYPSRSHHAVEHVCGLCYALCHRQRWFTDPDGHSQKVPGAWDGDAPAVENHRAVVLAARSEPGTGEVQPRETGISL